MTIHKQVALQGYSQPPYLPVRSLDAQVCSLLHTNRVLWIAISDFSSQRILSEIGASQRAGAKQSHIDVTLLLVIQCIKEALQSILRSTVCCSVGYWQESWHWTHHHDLTLVVSKVRQSTTCHINISVEVCVHDLLNKVHWRQISESGVSRYACGKNNNVDSLALLDHKIDNLAAFVFLRAVTNDVVYIHVRVVILTLLLKVNQSLLISACYNDRTPSSCIYLSDFSTKTTACSLNQHCRARSKLRSIKLK